MNNQRTYRYNYGRKTQAPTDTRTKVEKKASHLPLPGPGVAIDVPLHLLTEYLQLHNLEPADTRLDPNQPLILKVVRKKHEG